MPDSPCAWRTILPLCALRKTVWRPCGIWTKPGCPHRARLVRLIGLPAFLKLVEDFGGLPLRLPVAHGN
ncbi:hypothetical protein [uncultured Desulfovibrio sp.]|uniref:hypothetical protein n=1 Tax=uncultured Desulfovibrio sp. TaxID=167968 RepID=UPI00261C2643|nr:hypothetical protein [uncultured Desulfovibrio sp.]